MNKIGEAQVIDFFSYYLRDAHNDICGGNQPLAVGNFSGIQDKKFADFFASTNATNILIEFKEFKSEHTAEKIKPLREKLCKELSHYIAAISRQCHFIGWREKSCELAVGLNSYIDLVCPLWGSNEHLMRPCNFTHIAFVQAFLCGDLGVNYKQFVSYIDHLNNIAGGSAGGLDVPFNAVLYSRNSRGLKATIFQSLNELNELREILQRNISTPSPSRYNGPSF